MKTQLIFYTLKNSYILHYIIKCEFVYYDQGKYFQIFKHILIDNKQFCAETYYPINYNFLNHSTYLVDMLKTHLIKILYKVV